MKKFEVSHAPYFIKPITIALVLFWIVVAIVLINTLEEIQALALLLLILLAVWLIIAVMTCVWTTIEYDSEKISWKWLWLRYTVNFNEMDSVYYTVVSEFTRVGYNSRLEIVFKVKDMELKLNDRIETEDIENCINGRSSDVRLMALYKFIENIFPEKAKGFVRADDRE